MMLDPAGESGLRCNNRRLVSDGNIQHRLLLRHRLPFYRCHRHQQRCLYLRTNPYIPNSVFDAGRIVGSGRIAVYEHSLLWSQKVRQVLGALLALVVLAVLVLFLRLIGLPMNPEANVSVTGLIFPLVGIALGVAAYVKWKTDGSFFSRLAADFRIVHSNKCWNDCCRWTDRKTAGLKRRCPL